MTRDLPQTPRHFPEWAREQYREAGFRIVEPGSPTGARWFGFHGKDWHPDSFLALAEKKNQIEVALLRARHPGGGAFTRLVERLDADGYRVAVNSPLGKFREALARRGWRCEESGDRGEIWRRPD